MVQLCIELLVAAVAPSAIPTTIQTTYETFYGKCPEGRVSVDFVRRCRPVAEALGYYMVAMFLAGEESWDQMFFDATTRRQNPFSAMVMGCLGRMREKMETLIVSSSVFMEDESSQATVDSLFEKVSSIMHCWSSVSLLCIVVLVPHHSLTPQLSFKA